MPNAEPARRRAIWIANTLTTLTWWAASPQTQAQQAAIVRVLASIASDLGRAADANHGDQALAMTLWGIRGAMILHATRIPWRPVSPGELAEMNGSIVGMVVAARAIEAKAAWRARVPGGAA